MQKLFHNSFKVRAKSCGTCFRPVPQLDEEGNPRQDYVHPCVFTGLHLHHPSMSMSHDDYIVPAHLPLYSALPFNTRMEHYKILDLQCAGCHDQDEGLKNWTIPADAVSRILDIYYEPPDDEWTRKNPLEKMDEIVNGKLQAWEDVCHRHRLESAALIAPVSFEVLECLVYDTLGYKLQHLVTWAYDPSNWEERQSKFKCKRWMKMVALAYAKKEYGVCTGRQGIKCHCPDIRNTAPRRLTLYRGDHGVRDGNKKYDPATLASGNWTDLKNELLGLKGGYRCVMCDGNIH